MKVATYKAEERMAWLRTILQWLLTKWYTNNSFSLNRSLQLIDQLLYFVVSRLQPARHVQILRAFDFGVDVV